jgi:O-antigen ligase
VRVLTGLLLGLVGAVTGLASVAVHQRWWSLVLVVAAVGVTAMALPRGWSTRLPFALGFAAVLGLAMTPRAEGDYLVPANTRGYLLLGVGFVLLLTAITTLPRPGRRS